MNYALLCAMVSNPTFQLPQRDLRDHLHAGRAVVEAGDRREILPAVLLEDVRVLDRDLLQRLETVGGEAGRDHRQVLHAAPGEVPDGVIGRGREPLGTAEARLERQHQFLLVELELLAQETHRLDAMGVIGIAVVDE